MIRDSWERQKEIKNVMLFLQDHGVGLITTEYELRYILYLRGFERTLLDRAQENGCNALWAEGE